MQEDRVQTTLAALAGLGLTCTTDATSKTLQQVAQRLPQGGKHATVVTSPAAIRTYDAHNPERIACLVATRGAHQVFIDVVVKDRQYDVGACIRHQLNKHNEPTTSRPECAVCFRPLRDCCMCFACSALLCRRCQDKTTEGNAHKCPVCRTWTLNGDGFGTPTNGEHLAHPPPQADRHPVDVLADVLCQLDGSIEIVPRIGTNFHFDRSLQICRLFGTDRLAPGSLRMKDVKKKLKRLGDVRLYVIRTTFKVLDKPVKEISVFQISRGKLHQLSTDAWINVLERVADDDTPFCMEKVEYIAPSRFPLPSHVADMFAEINRRHPVLKTVSILVGSRGQRPKFVMNFDVDEHGAVLTMHSDMLEARLASAMEDAGSEGALYALCRTGPEHCTGFEFGSRSFSPLDPKAVSDLVPASLKSAPVKFVGLGRSLM